MWKKLALAGFFCMIVQTAEILANKPTHHLLSAKLKFPYSLIGDDFGILNEQDLAANTCTAIPEPFSLKSIAFPYWQCYATKDVSFECDSGGIPDPHEGMQGLIVIQVNSQNSGNDYVARRPWDISSCKEFRKRFLLLTKSTSQICISGSFMETTSKGKDEQVTSWVFDKYKTTKGCDSYFVGDCDLKYKIKHGCKVIQTNPGLSENAPNF